jgi:hypothetical protein
LHLYRCGRRLVGAAQQLCAGRGDEANGVVVGRKDRMDQPLQDVRHGQPAHAALKGRGRVDPHLRRMRTVA